MRTKNNVFETNSNDFIQFLKFIFSLQKKKRYFYNYIYIYIYIIIKISFIYVYIYNNKNIFMIFCVYIKIVNKYYQKHKEKLLKEEGERYQNFFEEEK